MVPTWKKDLDALVTETIAFAASVSEKKLAQSKCLSGKKLNPKSHL